MYMTGHYSRHVLCGVQLHSVKKALQSAALSKELSAYPFTAKASLPSVACRALGKAFAECRKSTRQRFTLGKMKMRKKPKNNSKIFQKKNFGGGRHRPAPACLHRSRCIFCAKFAANAAGGIRTHDLSLACLLLYHCTTLSLVSRFRYLSSYIILNQE